MRIFIAFLIIISASAGGYFLIYLKPEAQTKTPPKVIPALEFQVAKKSNQRVTIHSQGEVQSATKTMIIAEVSGKIIEVSNQFLEGAHIRKGDVLVQIDPTDYISALAQAKAVYTQAKLALEQELALQEQASMDWSDLGNGNAQELALRIPHVANAKASVDAAEAAMQTAKKNLDRTTVTAPYDGILLSRSVDLGQMVNSMSSPIAEIFSTDYAEIFLPLNLQELDHLSISNSLKDQSSNPKVSIYTDSDKEPSYIGNIHRVAGALDSRTRTISVIARLSNPFTGKSSFNNLKLGQFVRAEIEGKLYSEVYHLPRSSLLPDDHLLVIAQNNRIEKRSIDLLYKSADHIIINSGITDGEKVAVTSLPYIVDGMEVKPLASEVQ